MTNLNITTIVGDSFARILTFTDGNGGVYNLTGCTLYMTVKANESDLEADAVISKTIQSTQFTDPTGGVATVSVTAQEMLLIAPASYYYDIKCKTTNGTVFTIIYGLFEVLETQTERSSV